MRANNEKKTKPVYAIKISDVAHRGRHWLNENVVCAKTIEGNDVIHNITLGEWDTQMC